MEQNPKVIKAFTSVLDSHGTGAGGTRNISGKSAAIVTSEAELAALHSKEQAIVLNSGYVANEASISAITKLLANAMILSDEINHASIISGIQHASCDKVIFHHNDINHLEEILAVQPLDRPKIIVFESVYSMDGDICLINEITTLAKEYNALTYVGEAHAIGMYGNEGGVIAQMRGIQDQIDIIRGTLGKAFGMIGGYLAANDVICDVVRSVGSRFIFTTALPPALAQGALVSVQLLRHSKMERRIQKQQVSKLKTKLRNALLPLLNGNTNLVPVMVKDAAQCTQI